jgi:hypothetical protein
MSRAGKTAKAAPKGNTYYDMPHAKRVRLLEQNVPAALRNKSIWLLWRGVYNSERGKWDKLPFYANGQPRRGQNGSVEDRAALVTFDEALAALNAERRYTGLGIAPLEGEGIVAVDVDQVDANPDAAALGKALAACTYTEVSPSGNGRRALFTGAAPSRKKAPIELFGATGFVTITGWEANKKPAAPFTSAPAALAAHFGSTERAAAQLPAGTQPKVSSHKLREVLEDVPNDDLPYDDWLAVVAAVHDARHGDSVGRRIALEWSESSAKHEQKKFDTAWESFGRRAPDAPRVTFGTLLHMAGRVDQKREQRSPAPARVRPPLDLWRTTRRPCPHRYGGRTSARAS